MTDKELPPHAPDMGRSGHPKHWCERCRLEAEQAAPSLDSPPREEPEVAANRIERELDTLDAEVASLDSPPALNGDLRRLLVRCGDEIKAGRLARADEAFANLMLYLRASLDSPAATTDDAKKWGRAEALVNEAIAYLEVEGDETNPSPSVRRLDALGKQLLREVLPLLTARATQPEPGTADGIGTTEDALRALCYEAAGYLREQGHADSQGGRVLWMKLRDAGLGHDAADVTPAGLHNASEESK